MTSNVVVKLEQQPRVIPRVSASDEIKYILRIRLKLTLVHSIIDVLRRIPKFQVYNKFAIFIQITPVKVVMTPWAIIYLARFQIDNKIKTFCFFKAF